MKKIIGMLVLLIVLGCNGPVGTTEVAIQGGELGLPEELKGLKIYSVSLGKNCYPINIAILNGQINALQQNQQAGKVTVSSSTIIINKSNEPKVYTSEDIILETNELIVIKKK